MAGIFDTGIFDTGIFDHEEDAGGDDCLFDTGIFDTGIFDHCPDGEAATPTTGGWLTREQAAAQLREIRRQERAEEDRRAKIKAKARELEETIEEAYARATGKKRTARALEGTEKPQNAPPEQLVVIAQDVAQRLSGALAGSGKRYSRDRELLARMDGALAEIERLLEIENARWAEDEEAAVMLLLMVM